MSPRMILVGTALTAAALYGGTAAAADYPPSAPPTTVIASSTHGDAQSDGPAPAGLAATGNSDTATILEIGGVVLVAGAGLVVVKRRRRVAPS